MCLEDPGKQTLSTTVKSKNTSFLNALHLAVEGENVSSIKIAFIVICIIRSSIAIETIDEIIVELLIPTPLNMVNFF